MSISRLTKPSTHIPVGIWLNMFLFIMIDMTDLIGYLDLFILNGLEYKLNALGSE